MKSSIFQNSRKSAFLRRHSGRSVARVAAASTIAVALLASSAVASPLRINGSTTVNAPVAEAAEIVRAESGLEIRVDTQGGSSGGISALGDGLVEIGMSSRPVTEDDRARYPEVDFRPVRIGVDAVALVVSRDVWESGVRALDREQVRRIYEGRLTNWKEVGGADRRIAFFDKEPGRGTWEVFASWLYGDARKAPLVSHPEVGSNEEGRSKVATTRGALSQLSAAWADRKTVFPLGLRDPSTGDVIEPTFTNVRSGRYPMSRSLFVITDGEPRGAAKTFIDFLLGSRGQEIVAKHGYLTLDQIERASGAP